MENYAEKLYRKGKLSSKFSDEPFSTRWTRIYEDHKRVMQGRKLEVPLYFRAETHTPAFYQLLMHPRLVQVSFLLLLTMLITSVQLMQCLMLTPEVRLYPVYMTRGKAPDVIQEGAQTVDWHQDAEYTFYW